MANEDSNTLDPVPFDGRMDERALESHIALDPGLVGEPLRVLGQQLAEFEEDKDRLDLLAVDKDGEIVLIELKVAEDFRLTDLQALAYAGAYADRDPEDFAHTLRRYLERQAQSTVPGDSQPADPPTANDSSDAPAGSGGVILPEPTPSSGASGNGTSIASPVSLEAAKAKLVEFLEIDDFEGWQPSQQVRIKLVAPSFPRRVLKNVKHLGDVYGMPIEAIAARLYEAPNGDFVVAFERLLPLPGEDEFDLTLRRREERKRDANLRRRKRPSVVPLLMKHGMLVDGQTLYLHKTVLPASNRGLYDTSNVAFQVIVRVVNGSAPKFAWRPTADVAAEEFSPSAIAHELYKALLEDWSGDSFSTAVATTFTIEPDGKTLAEVALDEGLWSQADAGE